MKLTCYEWTVYNAIKNLIESEDFYCVHVKGIYGEVDDRLTFPQVKGLVGSLVKKGAVAEVEPNHFEHLTV